RVPERRFDLAPPRHVGGRADDRLGVSAGVEAETEDVAQPAFGAVLRGRAVLDRRGVVRRAAQRGEPSGAILGVHAAGAELRLPAALGRRATEDRLDRPAYEAIPLAFRVGLPHDETENVRD